MTFQTSRLLLSAAALGACALGYAGTGFAEPGDDHHDEQHAPPPGDHPHYHAPAPYHQPKGYQEHRWGAGETLPKEYRASRYTVTNYHAYSLHAPPRGYHWVRVDNDVVLASIATGAITEAVADLFY